MNQGIAWKNTKLFLLKNKVLIFPAILLTLLLGFTIFRISGTSIGIYHQFLYGTEARDPNLLFGHPQAIRSDEWLVNTQITMSQSYENFPLVNPNFTEGKNMSVTFDVPYKDWSATFKPQNFSFFFLPLEHALAFKWWFVLFALMVSAYFFTLKLLPNKIIIAVLVSILIACSPFVAWWYQTNIMMYGFLIMLMSMSIIDGKNIRLFKKEFGKKPSAFIKISTLSYLLVGFALSLYPPFQIPVALVVSMFLLGYLLNYLSDKPKKVILKLVLPFAAAVIVTGAICGTYVATRSEAIKAIAGTVYPGKRISESGGYDVKKLLVTYLQPQLQRNERGAKYDKNQSESSSFIVLPLFFIIPAIGLIIWVYRKTRKVDWILVTLIVCVGLFFLHLFTPQASFLTKLFLMSYVPQSRLIIGLGLVAIILLVYMIKVASHQKPVLSRNAMLVLIAYSSVFFLVMVWAGLETAKLYPDFISNKTLIVGLAAILISGLFLVIINKVRTGLTILAILSVGSVLFVNPLYVGLGPLYNGSVSQRIQSLSTPNDTWAAAENIVLENLPQASGRHAITGVSGYPSVDFWKYNSEPNDNSVYNRYAHIFLTSNDKTSLLLLGPDLFAVSAACHRHVSDDIDYVVSAGPLKDSCYELIDIIKYPAMTFYFYRLR